jgi:hypothetical protein
VRDSHIAYPPAWAGGLDRLRHRFLGTDALQHRVSTDAVGELLDAVDALVAAFGYDVSRAELASEPLPRFVAAHRDDPLGTFLLRREHTQETDRAITHDCNSHAGLHVRCVGGEPARAQDIGGR